MGSWHDILPPAGAATALALAAVAAGAVVGVERERREKPAGLRTMMLVSLGSCVFTQLSLALTVGSSDRSRLAAQVVTGVGFLGGGAILRGAGGVQGVTTAATVWAIAAIGMVIGAGYAVAGLALSALTLVILLGAAALEMRYLGPCRFAAVSVVFDGTDGKAEVRIDEILDAYRVEPASRRRDRSEDGSVRLSFRYCNAHKHHREFLTQLASLDNVRTIDRGSEDR